MRGTKYLEIVLGIATTFKAREKIRILSYSPKTSVELDKDEEKLPAAEKEERNLIEIDETVVKGKKKYCVYL